MNFNEWNEDVLVLIYLQSVQTEIWLNKLAARDNIMLKSAEMIKNSVVTETWS